MKVYINKFYFLDNSESYDIDFIPPILKRRMSGLDKMAVSVLNKAFSEDVQNIIFTSRFGEVDRLLKIISQYQDLKEVSPNTFSASVNNYPVSFFLLNRKKAIPYNALSGYKNTITSGLLASFVSDYDNTLFCCADVNKGKNIALALNISKKKTHGDEYEIQLKNCEKDDDSDEFIKLFKGDINYLKTSLFEIRRTTDD